MLSTLLLCFSYAFLCSLQCFLCSSYASPMLLVCASYAVLKRLPMLPILLCSSYASPMHLRSLLGLSYAPSLCFLCSFPSLLLSSLCFLCSLPMLLSAPHRDARLGARCIAHLPLRRRRPHPSPHHQRHLDMRRGSQSDGLPPAHAYGTSEGASVRVSPREGDGRERGR